MTQNKIEHLRNHLFATLEALSDEEKPMELERAHAIADVARVIVDSAKVEVQFMNLAGGHGTGFIPSPDASRELEPSKPKLIEGGRR